MKFYLLYFLGWIDLRVLGLLWKAWFLSAKCGLRTSMLALWMTFLRAWLHIKKLKWLRMGVLWGQDCTAAWIIPKVIWIKVGTDPSLLTYWLSFWLSPFLFLSHNVLTLRGISHFLPDLPQYFELAAFGVQVIEHEGKGDWRINPRMERAECFIPASLLLDLILSCLPDRKYWKWIPE